MLAKLTTPAVLLSGFLLTACGTAGLGTDGITDSACKSFRPIRASKADTEDTKRQVIGHNRAFDAVCPGQGGAPKQVAQTNG
jgi:predicted small secreted protein